MSNFLVTGTSPDDYDEEYDEINDADIIQLLKKALTLRSLECSIQTDLKAGFLERRKMRQEAAEIESDIRIMITRLKGE